MSLQQKLESIVDGASGFFGVSVKHLQTGEEAKINSDALFQLASCYKVPVLVTLFRDVEAGKLRLDTRIRLKREDRRSAAGVLVTLDPGVEVSIKDLAMLMIIVSDNVGTDKVIELVGGIENVEKCMKELGLANTHIHHTSKDAIIRSLGMNPEEMTDEDFQELLDRMTHEQFRKMPSEHYDVFAPVPENNVSTPTEMMWIMERIARKELISESASHGMLHILESQKQRNLIPYLLPNQARVASKGGSVGDVRNDVGIVYPPNEEDAFAIAVLSRENDSIAEADQTIARIAKAAYDHFVGEE